MFNTNMAINRICIATLTLSMVSALTAEAIKIDVTDGAGSLDKQLVELESTRDSEVILTGTVDVRDLRLLTRLSDHVTRLDMSGTDIAAYAFPEGNYKGFSHFGAGQLIPDMLAGTNVTEVVLPLSVTEIADNTFAHSALKSFEIPDRITIVGDYAFAGAKSLETVVVTGTPTFGTGTFTDCTALRNFTASKGIAAIPDRMFRNCTLVTSVPAKVSTIGAEAFRGSGLKSVNLNEVASVGDYAFAEIPTLSEVIIGGLVNMGTGVFFGDSGLENIMSWYASVPALVTAHSGVKSRLSLNSETIAEAAFANNPGITSVVLGNKVRRIGADAFRNDTGITNVDVTALGSTVPTADPEAFSGLKDSDGKYPIRLTVLSNSTDKWTAAPVWRDFRISDNSGVTGTDDRDIAVSAERHGNDITVHSSVPMSSVTMFSIGGVKYFTGGQGENVVTAQLPSDEIVVVKVMVADQIRIFKIR